MQPRPGKIALLDIPANEHLAKPLAAIADAAYFG